MKTLVIGASPKPQRYSYKAFHLLKEHGHETLALGKRAQKLEGWEILSGYPLLEDIDTVTLYLRAQRQEEYRDYLLRIKPRRVIFNPGAENFQLAEELQSVGIKTENACTLVLLHTNQY